MNINNILKKYVFLNDDNNEIIHNIDFSKTSTLEVAGMAQNPEYISYNENKDLSDYIFKFYAYNEILASFKSKNNGIISKEDLNVITEYGDFVNDFSKRIFSFILYACIAEARHSNKIEKIGLNRFNSAYTTEIENAYTDKLVEDFNNGLRDERITNYLTLIKNDFDFNDEDLEKYIKEPDQLKKWFIHCVKSMPFYDIPASFSENFNKEYVLKNPYNINENLITILNEQSTEENNIKSENLNQFINFIQFIVKLQKSGQHGDNGLLQRNLIKNKIIETSDIKYLDIEQTFKFLSLIFKNGFTRIGIYGGEPWSDIAKHALSFARGEINAEIFIDQALSLEHNHGNMFNKNFIFKNSGNGFHLKFLENEDKKISEYDVTDMENLISTNINECLLNLQSSSSVLSLCQFKDSSWKTLTANLKNNKELSEKNYLDHLEKLKSNYTELKKVANTIKSLPEMMLLAKKVGYSIPTFNYVNLMLSTIAKKKYYDYDTRIEKNINLNNVFSKIMVSEYKSIEVKNTYKKETFFQLHNLNSNNAKELTKEIIGGKAYGLTHLINKGFNVPKALVFDTKTCLSYQSNKKYFNTEFKGINKQISDYLTDDKNQPLLVSVRSGAPVSMPGMMDSILNVGIDDTTYKQLCKNYGKEVINDCAISFMTQFCSSQLDLNIKFPKNLSKALDRFTEILIRKEIPCNRMSLFPLSKENQIKLSVEAVFDSWNSPRAIAWRNEKNIEHNMGTAATVQQMVFGNKNDKSLTCVIFSRDCITGKPDIMGEYLQKAQGEDLVSGKKTPLPISQLKISNPKIYQEIEYIAKILEEEQKAIQDIEITVEDGKVFVLQMRNAVVSPEAQLALAKDMNLNLLDVVQPKNLIGEAKIDTNLDSDYNGLAASPGLISGIIVRNQEDIDKYKNEGKDLIFFSNQALPEHAPLMIATQGFITEFGGSTSHAAILARSMGKPCVVGIGKQESNNLESGSIVTIDASEAKIWKGELPIVISQEKAINLSHHILKDNNIDVNTVDNLKSLEIKTWTTQLSNFKVLPKATSKHKMFLNIAQQAVLALKIEYIKEKNNISKL